MQPRTRNPAVVVPEAAPHLREILRIVRSGAVDPTVLELVRLRVSQINGSAACVDEAARGARGAGVGDERLDTVAAWRETAYFTAPERAALALAEAATRLADRTDAVDDGVWDAAATHFDERQLTTLLLTIGLTNMVNRLHAPTRQKAGAWR